MAQDLSDSVKTQTKCPVSGKSISREIYSDAAGCRIFFADTTSRRVFNQDASKRLPALLKSDIVLEKIPKKVQKPCCNKNMQQKQSQKETSEFNNHSTTPPCGFKSTPRDQQKGCGAPQIPE